MVHLIQLEVTNFFCSAAEFQDSEFHFDRLWRHYFFLFKVKTFKMMFWHAKTIANNGAANWPAGWFDLEGTLKRSHVFHRETFRTIMLNRNLTIEELQRIGYTHMSIHEVELFDQSNIQEYLKSTFTLQELVLAASLVLA
jgi:hypothetical protein